MSSKVCSSCVVEKSIDNFSYRSDSRKHRGQCKQCEASRRSLHSKANTKRRKEYLIQNKDKIAIQQKEYYINNREHLLSKGNNYYWKNKNTVNEKANKRQKARRKLDLCFKLKHYVSCSIRLKLRSLLSKKNGKSCLDFLPYSINELKNHIENHFESWMNWDNWGAYNSTSWDDDNPTTWTWQLDHIIPHSTFRYRDIECDEFKRCWKLSNLRPFNAKQNHIDGVTRSRHDILTVGEINE